MDYTKITADPVVGPKIGQLYMDAPATITREASAAYLDMTLQVRHQFAELTRMIKVEFTDADPYGSAQEMFADVRRGRLAIYKTQPDQSHPLLSPWDNNRFRAVHDYFGHFASGRDFSRHGEEAAWVRHSQMFTGPARRAMTTETRGQNSAFIWINGGREFPEQKAILLPVWCSVVPERWIR
jgi:hypothetical protein